MLFILLGTLLYFVIGFVNARVARPAMISAATGLEEERYLISANGYSAPENIAAYGSFGWRPKKNAKIVINRDEVMRYTRHMIFGWPIVLPTMAVTISVNSAIDKVDPEVYDRQQSKIKELEKELGMGSHEHTYR